MQVFVLLLLGDGAVQNAVDKPGDGGHGGFQLVGDIGDKAAPGALGVGEGVCHVVKGEGQLAQLVGAGDRHPHGEIPAAKGAGRGAHLPQGLHQAVGKGPHHNKGDAQRRGGGHQEHLQRLPLEGAYRADAGGGEHRPHAHILVFPGVHGHADDKGGAAVQPAKGVAPLVHALGRQGDGLLGHRLGLGELAVGVISQQDVALQIGDKDIRVNAGGKGVDKGFQYRGLQLVGVLAGLGEEGVGHLRNGSGVLGEQVPLLVFPILGEKGHHHRAQHDKAEHHNAHGDGQVPGEDALLHGHFPSCFFGGHSFTSNL